jgi:phosphoadenosine phosphosulfate reductase
VTAADTVSACQAASADKFFSLNLNVSRISSLAGRVEFIAGAIEGRLIFSTSLGMEDQAILHAISECGADIDIVTLDTGRLFPETLETIYKSVLRYGKTIRLLVPEAPDAEALVARDGVFGFRHSIEARKACCHVRKALPLSQALSGAAGWITGLRRGQSAGRANVPFAAWDAEHRLVKFNPIADWELTQLEAYAAKNQIPLNPLHARGFPSIGCQPCTRALGPGEDLRAGRWWWEKDFGRECGLHSHPGAERAAE